MKLSKKSLVVLMENYLKENVEIVLQGMKFDGREQGLPTSDYLKNKTPKKSIAFTSKDGTIYHRDLGSGNDYQKVEILMTLRFFEAAMILITVNFFYNQIN